MDGKSLDSQQQTRVLKGNVVNPEEGESNELGNKKNTRHGKNNGPGIRKRDHPRVEEDGDDQGQEQNEGIAKPQEYQPQSPVVSDYEFGDLFYNHSVMRSVWGRRDRTLFPPE